MLGQFAGATGVKTGYTKKAGRCFVGSAKQNGMEVVCVLLNCNPMFEDCSSFIEEAFSQFQMVELKSQYETERINVVGANVQYVDVVARGGFKYPLKPTELADIHIEKDLPSRLFAPVNANQPVGQFKIYLKNDLIFSQNFYTIKGVSSNGFTSNVKKIIDTF